MTWLSVRAIFFSFLHLKSPRTDSLPVRGDSSLSQLHWLMQITSLLTSELTILSGGRGASVLFQINAQPLRTTG